ncbi:hypothetical protein SISSUDRAFT_964036, partial [Sistotremastrum suecicum HHB10207 ss-3]
TEHLPPQRKGKAIRRTSPPLSKSPFSNFIYTIAAVLSLVIIFYTWRIWSWKTDAGGWWNLALGRTAASPVSTSQETVKLQGAGTNGRELVEDKLSQLAGVLGIPAATLATAIASAVKEHVPPATLSSISKAEAPTASVVRLLVNDEQDEIRENAESFTNKLSGVVGLDEP